MSDTMTLKTLRDEEQKIILEKLRAIREHEDAKRLRDATHDRSERSALRGLVKTTREAVERKERELAEVRRRIELEEAVARKPGLQKLLRQAKALGQQRLKIVGRVDKALTDLRESLSELARNGEEFHGLSYAHRKPGSAVDAVQRPLHNVEAAQRLRGPLSSALPHPYQNLFPPAMNGAKDRTVEAAETRAVEGIIHTLERDLAEIDRIEKED